MGLVWKLKKRVKKIIANNFSKQIPVHVPVLSGNLLEGRTALITGGSGDIGYGIAKAFIQNGATVIITGRNKDRVSTACSRLRAESGMNDNNQVLWGVLDISDVKNIEDQFNYIESLMKDIPIDILVNNAGVNIGGTLGKTLPEDYDSVLDTNLKGTYFITQTVSNYMIRKKIKGNILNITSSSSLRPATSPYMVSKWGERGLTIGMAKKLVQYGITVNGIAPGPTATEMVQRDESDGLNNPRSPFNRYITVEEISDMAVVLVSGIGRSVVGDVIYMTGGAGVITVDDVKY